MKFLRNLGTSKKLKKKKKIELKIHAAKGFFELKNNNNKIEN